MAHGTHLPSLSTDELGLILKFLSLPYLIPTKCVNKQWAKAVRYTIHDAEWRRVLKNHRSVEEAPIRFCRYDTAAEAFATFDAASKVDKRLVSKKCKQLAQIHRVRLISTAADRVADYLFKNNANTGGLFTKSIKVLQKKDSDKIFIISDVEHMDSDKFNRFALRSAHGGMDVSVLELDYPEGFNYYPPRNVKMIGSGYPYFCRGKLAAIMI